MLFTDKKTALGNGIGIIKEIAKKYDGTYSAWQKTIYILLKQY